jgi:hypothetical protein
MQRHLVVQAVSGLLAVGAAVTDEEFGHEAGWG